MARCILDSSNNVESFDGKKYRIPMSTCYTVLAKDCGSPSSVKYSVLAKKLNEGSSDLKIKLMIPKKQFVLFVEDNKMVIEMNGVPLREEEYEQNGIHKISETRRPTYVLHCSHTNMELRFDGRSVMLSISHDYINRQCGVCGHYNLDSEDTLRMEDNTLASSLKEFHASYLYKDPECSEEAQRKFNDMKEDEYHKRTKFSGSHSEESSDELVNNMEKKNKKMQQAPVESGEEKKQRKSEYALGSTEDDDISSEFNRLYKKIDPIRKTQVVEEQDVICFSLKPQKSCPEGSYPLVEDAWADKSGESRQGPEVEFICMSHSSERARKILRQLRTENVISDLETMQSNKRMPVRQAKRCSQRKGMPAEY